ncbi:type II toxin-antitoxin system VapC family toxin [Candidatus Electronema sp. PJ]|uniref:type II toxin-antitoxin system VapC family toxin n=1 Tax=Candidatus Electronema sp. PJ TaxID=3401572 RepID=UPI003AA9A4A5
MPSRIYIETSIVSYLTSRPSKDLIRSACQQITKAWWGHGRLTAMSYSSSYVVEEAGAGDPQAASNRLNALRDIPLLPITPEIPVLAEFLLLGGALPTKARLDALHIACAAYHQMDVLLTWNCTHIAAAISLFLQG